MHVPCRPWNNLGGELLFSFAYFNWKSLPADLLAPTQEKEYRVRPHSASPFQNQTCLWSWGSAGLHWQLQKTKMIFQWTFSFHFLTGTKLERNASVGYSFLRKLFVWHSFSSCQLLMCQAVPYIEEAWAVRLWGIQAALFTLVVSKNVYLSSDSSSN